MLHILIRILIWIISLLALGVASLIVNLMLLVLKGGNLKNLLFVRKVVAMLTQVPGEMLLECLSGKVSAITFDASRNEEKPIPIYSGIITWSGSPQSASKVLGRARSQLRIRSTLFATVFIPLLALSIWFALFVHWWGILFAAFLIFHQFVPFYIWMYPAFSDLW